VLRVEEPCRRPNRDLLGLQLVHRTAKEYQPKLEGKGGGKVQTIVRVRGRWWWFKMRKVYVCLWLKTRNNCTVL